MNKATLQSDYIVFDYPFSYEINADLKTLGARWNNPIERRWSLKIGVAEEQQNFFEICRKWNFELQSEISEKIKSQQKKTKLDPKIYKELEETARISFNKYRSGKLEKNFRKLPRGA